MRWRTVRRSFEPAQPGPPTSSRRRCNRSRRFFPHRPIKCAISRSIKRCRMGFASIRHRPTLRGLRLSMPRRRRLFGFCTRTVAALRPAAAAVDHHRRQISTPESSAGAWTQYGNVRLAPGRAFRLRRLSRSGSSRRHRQRRRSALVGRPHRFARTRVAGEPLHDGAGLRSPNSSDRTGDGTLSLASHRNRSVRSRRTRPRNGPSGFGRRGISGALLGRAAVSVRYRRDNDVRADDAAAVVQRRSDGLSVAARRSDSVVALRAQRARARLRSRHARDAHERFDARQPPPGG